MSDRKIILIALGVAFALLLIYAISFIGTPISGQTSDWGAFGSYAAICVSSLSIALIYVTYREQRKTNEITRVEQHIVTMTNTLAILSEKYHDRLEVSYDKFSEHFKLPFYDISDWEYDKRYPFWDDKKQEEYFKPGVTMQCRLRYYKQRNLVVINSYHPSYVVADWEFQERVYCPFSAFLKQCDHNF